MTRILLPLLVAAAAALGLWIVGPIVVHEFIWPLRRTRKLDKWLEDVE